MRFASWGPLVRASIAVLALVVAASPARAQLNTNVKGSAAGSRPDHSLRQAATWWRQSAGTPSAADEGEGREWLIDLATTANLDACDVRCRRPCTSRRRSCWAGFLRVSSVLFPVGGRTTGFRGRRSTQIRAPA